MKKLFLLFVLATTHIYSQVIDEIGISATGKFGVFSDITLVGNIGIGMTPNYTSPYKLEVNGSTKVTGDVITDSNIGIGTTSFIDGQDTYRLSVNGKVRAHAVKIYTNWADFVFESDYELPTLEEVESYIQERGHLKDIPSSEEVETNGIELGEMNKLLLQKIEELTLYVIELNKDIESLKPKE